MRSKDQDLELTQIMSSVDQQLKSIAKRFKRVDLGGYTGLLRSPRRLIWLNFLGGLARGFGFAVGATLLGALFLLILFRVADLNLPVVGEFVARLVRIVQTHL